MTKILIFDDDNKVYNLAVWQLEEAVKQALRDKYGIEKCHVAVVERYLPQSIGTACKSAA